MNHLNFIVGIKGYQNNALTYKSPFIQSTYDGLEIVVHIFNKLGYALAVMLDKQLR